jgi:hypothetical protein
MTGSAYLAAALAARLGTRAARLTASLNGSSPPHTTPAPVRAMALAQPDRSLVIGHPEPALSIGWPDELSAAEPRLRQIAERYDQVLRDGHAPVTCERSSTDVVPSDWSPSRCTFVSISNGNTEVLAVDSETWRPLRTCTTDDLGAELALYNALFITEDRVIVETKKPSTSSTPPAG